VINSSGIEKTVKKLLYDEHHDFSFTAYTRIGPNELRDRSENRLEEICRAAHSRAK
jgi:hypothetical protein